MGCSPAWPNPGGAQSGYLVEHAGASVLLDCGPGVLARLRAAGGWPAPDAIVLSHFHLDHWGDLVGWVWGALFLGGQGVELGRPELWVPPGGIARLVEPGGPFEANGVVERVFTLREYAPGQPFAAGGFDLWATAVPHYGAAAHALRVEAAGRRLVYSGDSAPSQELVAAAEAADLFLCEATLSSGERDGTPRGHLSLDEALETSAQAGARSLLITHRPVELEVPAGVELARDGLVRAV